MFELQQEEQSPTRLVLGTIARSLPSLAVALLFIFVGYTKFDNDPRGEWVQMFERIGLGQWFRIFTGVVQVTGGALLLWPRARTIGAALLACTMVGAIIVDLFIIGSPMFIVPMMLLFLIAAVWAVSL
jgi:putative oxidoreductase